MRSATPLVCLDAIAIDTETTSLDTRRARIVEIGAVHIVRGVVDESRRFASLVNPGEPISKAATAIHGIDDARVANAPGFAEAYEEFLAFAGDAILIGHAVAFDMAVIARECRRFGLPFAGRPALDTLILAEVAARTLPDSSLESVAAWLDVPVVGRHSAPGDALTTAHIFVGLVPHLRARKIRTQGEAETACREIAEARDAAGHANWRPAEAFAAAPTPVARVDSFPFRHRNRDLMSAPPRLIEPARPLEDAIRTMTGERVSSLFVIGMSDDAPVGIVTERDVMRAVAADGAAALKRPVADFASGPLITVEAGDYAYRAIGRMSARAIRHLAVIDRQGAVIGALSARDLLRLRASEAISLGDEIDAAENVTELAAAWAKVPAVAEALLEEGVAAIDIAAIISSELAAVTRRTAMLGESRLVAEGSGPPPASYALLVLGSAGRGESLLAADQDNAIVFADTDDQGADAWFAALGRQVTDTLHEVGIPYCKGGVMSSNAEWRGSMGAWKARIGEWVTRSSPDDLLNVDIFFDLAPVHGATRLADELWHRAYDMGRAGADFAKLLAEAAAGFKPPVSFFGRLRAEHGRIDLKKGGLLPIVAGARVLSIRHRVLARSTPNRLAGIRALEIGAGADLDRLTEIHRLLLDHLLRQQLADLRAGIPPSNRVDIQRQPRSRLRELREALTALSPLDETIRALLFAEPGSQAGRPQE